MNIVCVTSAVAFNKLEQKRKIKNKNTNDYIMIHVAFHHTIHSTKKPVLLVRNYMIRVTREKVGKRILEVILVINYIAIVRINRRKKDNFS